MVGPDDRQVEILGKMGIDVWQRRKVGRADEITIAPVEEAYDSPQSSSQLWSQTDSDDNLPDDIGGDSDDLGQLAEIIGRCQKCTLHTTRTNAVPGIGNPSARWMFVGEAPGQNEDQQGLPFVGRAGQLLDAMIAALNMNRKDVFIANLIKCRPPGNRDPLVEEVDQCEPYLHQQLAIIKPEIIVALGRVSAQSLLKTSEPIGKIRGKTYHYGESDIPLIPTYHPAYLLRSPEQKRKVWEDLLLAKSIVESRNQEPDSGGT